jgi:alpha-1,6-mannosyltransferase
MPLALRRGRVSVAASLVIAAAGLAAYAGMAGLHLRHGTLRGPQVPAFLALYSLAFVAYLAALAWAEQRPRVPGWLIYGGALAAQLLLLLTTPTLSDDVYRYLWDGHVANHGISPYAYAIESPALDFLDVPVRSLANHPEMASPYLPAAQWLFRAVTALFPLWPVYLQAVMALLSLGSGWLIARLLGVAGLPGRRAIIYLWNPLVIVETAHGAHVDGWMVFLALLAAWLALAPGPRARREWLSPLVLAAATLTKVVPVLLLPALWWRWPRAGRALYVLACLALLLPAGLAGGWGLGDTAAGTGLFGALRIYNRSWQFNAGLYPALEAGLAALRVPAAGQWARLLAGGLLIVLLAAVWRAARECAGPRDLLRLAVLPLMGYILLTTTVHPWYLLILVAFLPFLAPGSDEPGRGWWPLAPWLYLSWALALSYLSYLTPGEFREPAWVRAAEWAPAWGLLIYGVVRAYRAQQRRDFRLHQNEEPRI